MAHKSDVFRLRALYEEGGIYMDMDVVCVRSFAPLFEHACVLGAEGKVGLCNAVILAEPHSEFIRLWLEGFDPARSLHKGFRSKGHDHYWNELSVRYPKLLATRYPDLIHIEPEESFFWPQYTPGHLQLMFAERNEEALPPLFIEEESALLSVDPAEVPALTRQRLSRAYCHHLWETITWEDYLRDLEPEKLKRSQSVFADLVRAYL